MTKRHNILIVPGLGDQKTMGRNSAYVGLLNKLEHNRQFLFFDPLWESDETATAKTERLKAFYYDNNEPETVFAFSAGVPLAVGLIEKAKSIKQAHFVCGKALGAEKIQQRYLDMAPAFLGIVRSCERIVGQGIEDVRSRVTCYAPRWRADDAVIEKIDMLIPGAVVKNLPPFSHLPAIIYSLVRYLPFV